MKNSTLNNNVFGLRLLVFHLLHNFFQVQYIDETHHKIKQKNPKKKLENEIQKSTTDKIKSYIYFWQQIKLRYVVCNNRLRISIYHKSTI